MRKVINKTSFLGGEAGPLLEGRSDLAQFQLGLTRGGAKNFIVLKNGAVTRRPGTRYVKNTQGDQPARLIEFIISYDSGDDMFVVEISALYVRVIRLSDNTVYTPTGITPTFSDSGVDGVSFGKTGGFSASIQYAQSADFLFLTNGESEPIILRRSSTTPTFALANYKGFTLSSATSRAEYFSIPYRDANIDASHTMSISNASVGTGRTLTSSTAFFTTNMAGTYFRVFDTGFVKITSVGGFGTPQTTATVDVVSALDSTAATSNWAEGAWSDHRGWPRAITFYNGRLCFGGNESQPDTVWCSQVDDYFQMWDNSAGLAAIDGPKTFTLRSGKLNQIQWMTGGKKLSIGTSSSEWVGELRDDGTNLFIEFNEETTHGSSRTQARRLGYSVPFVQRSGRTIREMTFDFDSDSYVATDLNLFASHVGAFYDEESLNSDIIEFKDKTSIIKQVGIQTSPFDILWALDTYGRLYGLTRDKQQQIAAWHSHQVGAAIEQDDEAQIVSFCVAPSPYTGATPGLDRVWLCVKREINGVEKFHIEYIDDIRDHKTITVVDEIGDDISHLDCSTIQTGVSSTAWSNLTRFANDSCYVIAQDANGLVVHDGEIAVNGSGEITLPIAATTVVAGLLPNAELRLLPFEGGEAPEIKGRSIRKADAAAIKLYQTFQLKIGKNRIMRSSGMEENTSFELIPFSANSASPLPTFTGVKEVSVPTDPDADGSFALVKDDPWPCTILSISSRVVANEV